MVSSIFRHNPVMGQNYNLNRKILHMHQSFSGYHANLVVLWVMLAGEKPVKRLDPRTYIGIM
jgi:hypothetical protein